MVRTTALTSRRIFLIDTSYLLELFGIPGHSTREVALTIEQRYNQAIKDRNKLVVPLPCIFELGNHIAQVPNGYYRREIARILLNMIKTSVRTEKPWTITPATGVDFLPELFENFTHDYVIQGVGLVDTFIIQEAKRLKNPYSQVHIWTKDHALKAYEPDTEEAPFMG